MEFQYEFAGKSYPVRIVKDEKSYKISIAEEEFTVTSKEIKPGFIVLNIDGRQAKLSIATESTQRHIFFDGAVYRFTRSEGRKKKKAEDGVVSPDITSPISGKVVKVDGEQGAKVRGGQTLMTIEAMKMEYQIKAPYDGIVEDIKFKEGDQVDIGVVLIVMDQKKDEESESIGSD